MKTDLLKTLAGLAVIAAIVLVTFLYGNAQRDRQVASKTTASPQVSAASVSGDGKLGTASVPSPSANALQGGGTPTPSATPKPTATPAPVATPAALGASTMPATGSADSLAVVGAAVMASLFVMWRRSRKLVAVSVRARR